MYLKIKPFRVIQRFRSLCYCLFCYSVQLTIHHTLTYVSASIPQLSLMCDSAEEALQPLCLLCLLQCTSLSPLLEGPREKNTQNKGFSHSNTQSQPKSTQKTNKANRVAICTHLPCYLIVFIRYGMARKQQTPLHLTQNEILAMY